MTSTDFYKLAQNEEKTGRYGRLKGKFACIKKAEYRIILSVLRFRLSINPRTAKMQVIFWFLFKFFTGFSIIVL